MTNEEIDEVIGRMRRDPEKRKWMASIKEFKLWLSRHFQHLVNDPNVIDLYNQVKDAYREGG